MKLKQRKKMLKRKPILMVSIGLLLLFSIAGTLAFLTDSTEEAANTFIAGKVTTEITEKIDGDVKKDVAIKNTGNIDAYIRAMVVVTWQDENGNVYGETPTDGTHYTLDWYYEDGAQKNDNWEFAEDGFYYHKLPVSPEDSTSLLFTNCKLADGVTPPEGYYLNVEILGSGIQALPTSVVVNEWSSGVSGFSDDGTTLLINGITP